MVLINPKTSSRHESSRQLPFFLFISPVSALAMAGPGLPLWHKGPIHLSCHLLLLTGIPRNLEFGVDSRFSPRLNYYVKHPPQGIVFWTSYLGKLVYFSCRISEPTIMKTDIVLSDILIISHMLSYYWGLQRYVIWHRQP